MGTRRMQAPESIGFAFTADIFLEGPETLVPAGRLQHGPHAHNQLKSFQPVMASSSAFDSTVLNRYQGKRWTTNMSAAPSFVEDHSAPQLQNGQTPTPTSLLKQYGSPPHQPRSPSQATPTS